MKFKNKMAGQIVMGYNFFNNKIKIKILDNNIFLIQFFYKYDEIK